jgi:ferredoxin-NADP reductase
MMISTHAEVELDLVVLPQDQHGLLDLDGLLAGAADGRLVYCCGPGPLLDAVEQRCAGRPGGSLHTDEERAANDTMFVCVSRAACPRLVRDL